MKYKDTQLTPEEKAAMRSLLLRRMRMSSPMETPVFDVWRFLQSLRVAAVGLTSVVLVSAGISYAAEDALPGDTLYAVKVEVNERVRTWAAVSEQAQAEWSVARTTRRLEELEQLAAGGNLDEKTSSEIASRLEQNTEEANKVITSLKKARIDVAADTSSRLESSFRVHERTLIQVAEDRADMSSQIHVILDTVREKAERVSEIRQEIEKERADMDNPPVEGLPDKDGKGKDIEAVGEKIPKEKIPPEQKKESATTTTP